MNIGEILDAKNKLEKGFDIFVESLVNERYNKENGFYFYQRAVGRIIKIKECEWDYETYYDIYVEWIKDKVWIYTTHKVYDIDIHELIKLKEIVSPKNPNQLELFK